MISSEDEFSDDGDIVVLKSNSKPSNITPAEASGAVSEDEFSDDGDISFINAARRQRQQPLSSAINRTSVVTKTGQRTLEGGAVAFEDGTIYEEIRETNITFGPTHHQLNYDNLSSYIYPTNFEVRDYQFDIVKRALFENVFCALPTGLGKTFIASTVMLNFFRWTSDSKVIFMAPTRPLVAQQIKACYGVTGIPSDETAILLDKTKRNRAEIWTNKRVFFTTPQVVENDLKSGLLDPKEVVCIVIDEAHRAKGNYAYNNVIKFLKRFNSSFRVLALSATPGSDMESIQQIIDNLLISKIEVRTEESPDTAKYMKSKDIKKIDCEPTDEISYVVSLICEAISPVLKKCNTAGIYNILDPAKINHFMAMERAQKVIKNQTLAEGLKWSYYFQLQLLGTVGMFLRRLNIYGIKTFFSFYKEKAKEFTTKYESKKSTNKTAASFYYHAQIKEMEKFVEKRIAEDEESSKRGAVIKGVFSHSKLQFLLSELQQFLDSSKSNDSKVIVFTEFRESALEIVKCIEAANKTITSKNLNGYNELLRPHIFIGQSKEKEKFDQEKYLKKNAPKGRGKKKEAEPIEEPTPKKKAGARPTDRVGSSEDAQLKGMNQKLQKELIQKFKEGDYNILVATSIGEEGLDIGEVDLIVCFDSTSSPIKNIQRMGRTGRKRDGKILLLLSSNEREKFDKSMKNYESIQSQIQTSTVLSFHESDRIVPPTITPFPEKRFIEIPEENEEIIQQTEDSDEFLKLATQLTTKTGKKKATKKSDSKQQKLTKRFFMPDNVETGFRAASDMVKKLSTDDNGENDDNRKRKSDDKAEPPKKRKLFEVISDESDPEDDITNSQLQDISCLHSSLNKPDTGLVKAPVTSTPGSGIANCILLDDSDNETQAHAKKSLSKKDIPSPQPEKPVPTVPNQSILNEIISIDLDEFSDDEIQPISFCNSTVLPKKAPANTLLKDTSVEGDFLKDIQEGDKTKDPTIIEDSEDSFSDDGNISAFIQKKEIEKKVDLNEKRPGATKEVPLSSSSQFEFSEGDINIAELTNGTKQKASVLKDISNRNVYVDKNSDMSISLNDSNNEFVAGDHKNSKQTVLNNTPSSSKRSQLPPSLSAKINTPIKSLGVSKPRKPDIISSLKPYTLVTSSPKKSKLPLSSVTTPIRPLNMSSPIGKQPEQRAAKIRFSSNQNTPPVRRILDTKTKNVKKVTVQKGNSHNVDPVFKSKFNPRDGFMEPSKEYEFYKKFDIFQPLNFNIIDNPVTAIRKGAVNAGVSHSSSMSSLIDVIGTMQDKRKLNRLCNRLNDYHQKNRPFKMDTGGYLLQDVIVDDMNVGGFSSCLNTGRTKGYDNDIESLEDSFSEDNNSLIMKL